MGVRPSPGCHVREWVMVFKNHVLVPEVGQISRELAEGCWDERSTKLNVFRPNKMDVEH